MILYKNGEIICSLAFFLFLTLFISSTCASGVHDPTIEFNKYVDVPDSTVSYDNYIGDINNVGSYQINEDIQIRIEIDPSINNIQIILVDKNKNRIWVHNTQLSNGTNTVTIPGQSIASTYGVVLIHNREYKGAKPVVISEYSMTLSPNKTQVSKGERLDFTITIKKNGMPTNTSHNVQGILFQGSSKIAKSTAFCVDTGIYKATIVAPSIPGIYSLYGIIDTSDYIMGYPELTGIIDGGSVNVVQADSSVSSTSHSASSGVRSNTETKASPTAQPTTTYTVNPQPPKSSNPSEGLSVRLLLTFIIPLIILILIITVILIKRR
jgi:hypothetical protein